MIAALPDLLATSVRVASVWNDSERTPLRDNVAFIRQHVSPNEANVFFLSNHSGFYYYLTDTVRSFKIPGMIELLRTQDMNTLVEEIRARRINKLFVEQNFFAIQMYRPDVYDELRHVIDENYTVSEAEPSGTLVLYTPRRAKN